MLFENSYYLASMMNWISMREIAIVLTLTFWGCTASNTANTDSIEAIIPKPISLEVLQPNIPELRKYHKDLKTVLGSPTPILLTDKNRWSEAEQEAMELVMESKEFRRNCHHFGSGAALHSEIMGVYPLGQEVFRVEMYNFFYNSTSVAEVDVEQEKVLKVNHISAYNPELNARLKNLAVQVASHYPEVKAFLDGGQPDEVQLGDTKSERSRHLSIAPVFVKGEKALWTIVDLHHWTVVGIKEVRKTDLDEGLKITERMIQNEYVMENYCDQIHHLEQGSWELDYVLTRSDGLEVRNARYKGKLVLKSAKLVDWHVNYPFGNGYGFSDAMGCPMYSSAAVVAFNKPELRILEEKEIPGFQLIQDFRSPVWPLSCNYRYQNLFEFYEDGTFRVTGVNMGLGCGVGANYKPVFRCDLFGDENGVEHVEKWQSGKWETLSQEGWSYHPSEWLRDSLGAIYKIGATDGQGYRVIPLNRWGKDRSRVDFSYSYVCSYHKEKEEGQSNMSTIGTHDAKNHKHGPDKFVNGELLSGGDVVLWYVPQMSNDSTEGSKYCWVDVLVEEGKELTRVWPGEAGLVFVPIKTVP